MGMYDHVRCRRPLPDGYKDEFQSKDLDCHLDTYTIAEDGRLYKEPYHPHEARTDMRFDGVLNFYSYAGDPNDPVPIEKRWHEYNAKFTDGQLVEIKKVETT